MRCKKGKKKYPTERSIFFESNIYGCTFTMLAHSPRTTISDTRVASAFIPIIICSGINEIKFTMDETLHSTESHRLNAEWCSVLHFSREFDGCGCCFICKILFHPFHSNHSMCLKYFSVCVEVDNAYICRRLALI